MGGRWEGGGGEVRGRCEGGGGRWGGCGEQDGRREGGQRGIFHEPWSRSMSGVSLCYSIMEGEEQEPERTGRTTGGPSSARSGRPENAEDFLFFPEEVNLK